MQTRVLVAESYTLVRQGLTGLLDSDPEIKVVGEAGSGFEALSKAQMLAPHVVLMDCDLLGLDGISATRLIRREAPNVHVLLFSLPGTSEEEVVMQAVQAGARGYVNHGTDASLLVHQIKQIASGGVALSEDLTAMLLEGLAKGAHLKHAPKTEADALLSPREKEVLDLICQGFPNKQIGSALYVSENTVRVHVRSLMQKLEVENRTQLAIYGMRFGYGLREAAQADPREAAAFPMAS